MAQLWMWEQCRRRWAAVVFQMYRAEACVGHKVMGCAVCCRRTAEGAARARTAFKGLLQLSCRWS